MFYLFVLPIKNIYVFSAIPTQPPIQSNLYIPLEDRLYTNKVKWFEDKAFNKSSMTVRHYFNMARDYNQRKTVIIHSVIGKHKEYLYMQII